MKDELCPSDVDYNDHIVSRIVHTAHGRYPVFDLKVQEVKKMIRVMVVPPNGDTEVKEIEGTLEEYQELVGGYIQAIPFPHVEGVMAICDEEGKLKRKTPNLFLYDYRGRVVDVLVGTVVFVGEKDGDFSSLTDEQVLLLRMYIDEGDLA